MEKYRQFSYTNIKNGIPFYREWTVISRVGPQLGAETCAPVMFSGMTNTQWLRRLRLNVAWVIVLRVANSISVDYNCIVFEYFFGINWKLFRNCLFIRKVSSYFKEFVYFVVREFQRISNHAQRIRNLFYSLGMNPILMEFTNCLV